MGTSPQRTHKGDLQTPKVRTTDRRKQGEPAPVLKFYSLGVCFERKRILATLLLITNYISLCRKRTGLYWRQSFIISKR